MLGKRQKSRKSPNGSSQQGNANASKEQRQSKLKLETIGEDLSFN